MRRTKKALREGLAELMMEKDLRSITVRELADHVDIHRATFYSHYKDIYDLYEQMEDMVVSDLAVIVGDTSLSDEEFYSALVGYVYDNAKICRMFLDRNGNRSFFDRVCTFMEEKYLEIWVQEAGKNTVTEEWGFYAAYHIMGCLAIISRWAESDYSCPKEKLMDMILTVDTGFDKMLMH